MKIGYLQFKPVLGEPETNIQQLDRLIDQAAHADLLVLPELANSGYNFQSKDQAVHLAEEIPNGKFTKFILKKSKQHDLHIVAGVNETEQGKLYNTSILTGPNGFIGKYRKIHLFSNEFDFFERGNLGLPVFDIPGAKIGILICFDWVFPEVWRILAMKGVSIICHPSNLVLPYAQQAVPAHCLMNRIFTITANRYGTEHGVTFSGQSVIASPEGKILIKAPVAENNIGIVEIDPSIAENKQLTARNHIITDRIPQLYADLCKSTNRN